MRRVSLLLLMGILMLHCAGVTHFYNREGWSYSLTQEAFKNRLVISPKEAILEKAEPVVPTGAKINGVASVKVLIDPDGVLVAAAIDREIPNGKWMNKNLIAAAKRSKYAKMKDQMNRPTHYVAIIVYSFR